MQLVNYSDKSFAVIGETKEHKDDLKKLGGRFNSHLSCGAGWIFSHKLRDNVAKYLATGEVIATPQRTKESKGTNAQALQIPFCMDEYKAILEKTESPRMLDYCLKSYHAYKLPSGKIIETKIPQIKTRFCFGENGREESIRNANAMCAHAERHEEYFLSENLKDYDNKIKALTDDDNYLAVTRYLCRYNPSREIYTYGVIRNCEKHLCANMLQYSEEISDEDLTAYVEILKQERALFEKRLKTYLKRYGLSKIQTWTYWTER